MEVLAFNGSSQQILPGRAQDLPLSSFEVQVLETLKGSLSGIITVSQSGGYDRLTGDLILFEGTPLLEIGSRYWLATRNDVERDYRYVMTRWGKLRVESPEHNELLKNLLTEAIQNQVPYWLDAQNK